MLRDKECNVGTTMLFSKCWCSPSLLLLQLPTKQHKNNNKYCKLTYQSFHPSIFPDISQMDYPVQQHIMGSLYSQLLIKWTHKADLQYLVHPQFVSPKIHPQNLKANLQIIMKKRLDCRIHSPLNSPAVVQRRCTSGFIQMSISLDYIQINLFKLKFC